MIDNDQFNEQLSPQPHTPSQRQAETPFHLSKHPSISEIAPETQRSSDYHNLYLRSSLEQMYGLVGGGTQYFALQQLPSKQSDLRYLTTANHLLQASKLLNPNATDFGLSEEEEQALDDQGLILQQLQQQRSFQNRFEDEDESILCKDGGAQMIVWGRNQMGQLGIDPTAQSVIKFPTLSVNIRGWNSGSYPYSIYNVRQIACGKAHTMILIERDGIDIIFALGNNKQGQLGIGRGAGNIVTQPSIVESMMNQRMAKISCSKNSTFALTETGKLYSWGSYKEGVLGHGTLIDDYHTPQQIRFPIDSCIIDISAGKAHAGAVVKRQSPVNSKDSEYVLYMWGSNKYGQLGLGDSCNRDIPSEAQIKYGGESSDFFQTVSIKDQSPSSLTCGESFTMVKSMNGHIFSCGSNIQGQLGLGSGPSNKVQYLSRVILPQSESPVEKIDASDFTTCLLKNGNLYLWGPTPLGQFNEPKLLQELLTGHLNSKLTVKSISIGISFGLIQDTKLQCFQIGSLFHENGKQHYDSSQQPPTQSTLNFQMLANGPLPFDQFQCGNDFVVALSSQPINFSQPRKSKSHNARIPNVDKVNKYSVGKNNTSIYGNDSLSPMRTSLHQIEKTSHSSNHRRNEYLNRSAMIQGSALQSTQKISALKILRDSCTPVKQFIPPQCQNEYRPSAVLMSGDHSFSNSPKQKQVDNFEDESQFVSSQYSTQKVDLHHAISHTVQSFSTIPTTPQQQDIIHPQQPPLAVPKVPPLNHQLLQSLSSNIQQPHQHPALLNSSLLSSSIQGLGQPDLHQTMLLEHLVDVLMREKHELQHSLNIEIQKRLLAERDQLASSTNLEPLKQEVINLTQTISDMKLSHSVEISAKDNEILQLNEKNAQINKKYDELKSEVESLEQQVLKEREEKILRDEEEQVMAKKNREIYELTVQLGCLKEENTQMKRDQEDLKRDFEERLRGQQDRAKEDYQQLMQEYRELQEKCQLDESEREKEREEVKKKEEEQEEKIRGLEEKVKKVSAINEKMKGMQRKRIVAAKVDSGLHSHHQILPREEERQSLGVKEEPKKNQIQSQENSFQSINSKKGGNKRSFAAVHKSNDGKENLGIQGRDPSPAVLMETTQNFYNPIETPNESQKATTIVIPDKKSKSVVSQQNLFKKSTHSFNQPVLLSSTHLDPNRQSTNREQGCLQIQIDKALRKKSVSGQQPKPNVLKPNTTKLNQQQPVVSVQCRPASAAQTKTITPSRTPPRQAAQQQETVKTQRLINKDKQISTVNNSTSIGYHRRQPSKEKSIPQTFQLNNEDSIFDPMMMSNGNQIEEPINHDQEITLGGDDHRMYTISREMKKTQSSPGTPQMASLVNNIDSQTIHLDKQQNSPIIKGEQVKQTFHASSSSSSTIGCGVIMSEMRNKLIDIQNNKQYIEQKIQEYEKKLLQLKGNSSQLGFPGPSTTAHHNFQSHSSSQYYDLNQVTKHAYPGQMSKSNSGFLILNTKDTTTNQHQTSRR